jgi:nitrogen regulatory protein P-II 1
MNMYMIMFVLDDLDRLDEILDAWNRAGISGATIVESTGINRRRIARQVGTNYMAGINRLIGSESEGHFTLFAIVPSETFVQRCLEATESIVGDLDGPNTGVLAAWPLPIVKGVPQGNP